MKFEDQRLLLSILAHHEVIFEPYRWQGDASVRVLAAIAERRKQCLTVGIDWSTGGDGASRQRGYLAMKRLQSGGWIRMHRSKKSQRATILLRRLDPILHLAQHLTLSESWQYLEHLAAVEADPEAWRSAGFVLERYVATNPDNPHDGLPIASYIVDTVGLRISGLIDSWCDGQGCLGWRVTPEGYKALEAGPPEVDQVLIDPDPELDEDEYDELVRAGLAERQQWQPSSSSHIAIPLSCGLWMTKPEWDEYNARRTEGAPA